MPASWQRQLARQKASGLTLAAFCRQEQVSVSLWKNWQRQIKPDVLVASATPPLRPAMLFAPVEIIPR